MHCLSDYFTSNYFVLHLTKGRLVDVQINVTALSVFSDLCIRIAGEVLQEGVF